MPKRPVHPPAPREAVIVGARPRGPLRAGDLVQLIDAKGNKYTITLKEDLIFHSHRGQLAHNDMIGRSEGIIINSDRAISYQVLRPGLDDYVLSMPRGATVVYPKDAARIVGLADIGEGSRVLEAGVGSGALTCSLLRGAGITGSVVSIERREDFAEIATENVCRWFNGFPESWSLKIADLVEFQPDLGGYDSVVLDMLAPWECLEVVESALRPGGALVAYVATTTQLSRLVETVRVRNVWTEPRAEESLLRTWHLDGLSVRPDHKMNGHTGFLVSARLMNGPSLDRKRRPAPGAYGVDYHGPGGENKFEGTTPLSVAENA
jgi:tRNA (adenine57-N1/adenine58-N1)-methyltransferase